MKNNKDVCLQCRGDNTKPDTTLYPIRKETLDGKAYLRQIDYCVCGECLDQYMTDEKKRLVISHAERLYVEF